MTSSHATATLPAPGSRVSARTRVRRAIEMLRAHGEPDPRLRHGIDPDDTAASADAAATALMDLFRRTHDAGVFEALVELVQGPMAQRIRGRLRFLGAALDPNEVLQDTLVNVYRYPDRFDGERPGAFRAWSAMIVDNTIRRHLRRARSGPDVQLRPIEVLSRERDQRAVEPSVSAQHSEEYRAAWQAFQLLLHCYLDAYQDLSERERFVLQMVEVRGMRYAELAAVLEIRPEALKMVVFRARRRIHDRLTVRFSRCRSLRAAG